MIQFAKISTGLTVFAGAGFLIGAILTDNGSENVSSENTVAKIVKVEPISTTAIKDPGIDNIITSSIKPVKSINVEPLSAMQKTRERRLELLRKHASTKQNKPIEVQQVAAAPAGTTYTVQPGDTLFGIGRKNGLSVPQIAKLNGLSDPYRIRPGQKLIVSQ